MTAPLPVEEVLAALRDPAMLLNIQGRVAVANGAARDRFGAWVLDRSYVSVLRQPTLLGPVEDAFFHGKAGLARFVHGDGEMDTTFEVTISPLPGMSEGDRAPVLLVFHDVSDAKAGDAMRRDFVANVSHELKTPLTAALGFIETLQGPARDDVQARERFLSLMGQELRRMNRLVSDLLSLSRLQGQSRRAPREAVDLAVVLGEAVELLGPMASDLAVTVAADAPGPAMVRGDRDQLSQVAANLLENAIKYGERPGQVTLTLTRMAHEPVIRGPAWLIAVRDTGPGIASEHLPRLTERFYRVDTGRSRSEGGTGLGLAIVKHIVNRHRGRLRIESVMGRGTTVTVTLPCMPQAGST